MDEKVSVDGALCVYEWRMCVCVTLCACDSVCYVHSYVLAFLKYSLLHVDSNYKMMVRPFSTKCIVAIFRLQ